MKSLFGGLIAVILLGIYIHLIKVAIKIVYCVAESGCPDFNEGMSQALSVIGGLVSALVIAELAVAQPGEPLAKRTLSGGASSRTIQITAVVAACYVLVWIGAGLTAFMVGLYHPDKVPALTTLGQAWLGLAVSAAYAYFGIKQPGG